MIRKILIRIRNAFSEWKIYVSRITGYVNLVNMAGIIFIMLTDRGVNLKKWGFLLFASLFCIVTIVGWLDTKLGFFRQEAKRTADRNPYFAQILEGQKRINERLDNIEKSQLS